MNRDKLKVRLRQLYLLEFFNVFWLPLAFWFMARTSHQILGLNSTIAMILNGIFLLEGSYLWYCISRQLRLNMPNNFVRLFRILKNLNFIFFALAIVAIATVPFSGSFDKITTASFVLLAALEHINYFEIQLMYDNTNDLRYLRQHRRLKVAKLKRLMNSR